MATRSIGSMPGLSWFSAAIAVLLTSSGWSAEAKQDAAGPDAPSAALVRAALEKELAGDNSQREALLRQALSLSPKDAAAHWQLGQVRVQDKWQSTAGIESASRYDKRLAEYAQRRDAAGANVADQIALTRWCRKNRLDDQQRVHWLLALQIEPDNAEAIKALGLRVYHGTLAMPAQINKLTASLHRVSQAADRWRPRVAQWLGGIERNSTVMPSGFRDDLGKISDSCEMLGLERSLWLEVGAKGKKQELHRMTLATMLALADNPYPAAAESLVRGAVFSEFSDVRTAAITGLKKHALDHYVPLLLSGLKSPIEASAQYMLSDGGDLIAGYSVWQEGALNNTSYFLTFSPVYPGPDLTPTSPPPVLTVPGSGKVTFARKGDRELLARRYPGLLASYYADARASAAEASPRIIANAQAKAGAEAAQADAAKDAANAASRQINRQGNAQRSQAKAIQDAGSLRDVVDRANRAIARRNAQIETALCGTTGLDLGEQPTKWWTWWWQDYNESYNLTGGTDQSGGNQSSKPEYSSGDYVEYPGAPPAVPVSPQPTSRLLPSTVGGGPVFGYVPGRPIPHSCFAPGTKVWTLTGRQPIEKIKAGDCVLAEDIESGELAYKPVLAVTVRQPGARMRVGFGSESIIATPSHPFWVLGQGWRMTKQLEVGSRIHTPSGGATVESTEKLEPDPGLATGMAYNLIVADFNSYLVGDRGILVHDNTPRAATAALLPGLSPRQQ